MRITIDPVLCEGNAVCEALAPADFELDEADQARVVAGVSEPGGTVAEVHRPLVERAVDGCPRLAISLAD
jgi:ferredoxin